MMIRNEANRVSVSPNKIFKIKQEVPVFECKYLTSGMTEKYLLEVITLSLLFLNDQHWHVPTNGQSGKRNISP